MSFEELNNSNQMSNSVLTTFTNFQKARVQFVQSVAELSKRKENLDDIVAAGGLLILRPMITDVIPSIAQTSCIALGRLAAESQETAETMATLDIIPQVIYSMAEQNRLFKKCAAFLLRSVAKHTPNLAQNIVDHGGLDALRNTLEDNDPGVKEAGCWALSFIAKHSAALASAVVETVQITQLVECVKEPEIPLKRIAINCLTQIAKHSEDLSKTVALKDFGLINYLCPLAKTDDVLLKRQTLACLGQIASGRREFGDKIIETLHIDQIVRIIQEDDIVVRINAIELLKNIVKNSQENARIAMSHQAEKALVSFLREAPEEGQECAIECLRLLGSIDEMSAYKVLQSEADVVVSNILKSNPKDTLSRACVRLIGTLYQFVSDSTKSFASSTLLPYLMSLVPVKHRPSDTATEELLKCISNVLKSHRDTKLLETILKSQLLSPNLQYVIGARIYSIIQNDAIERKMFAKHKGLETIWEMKRKMAGTEPTLVGMFEDICSLYPDELVRLYNPDYPAILLKQLEKNY
jgi:hypothetical protein